MKKFAVIVNVGTYKNNVIDCTVKETYVAIDTNTFEEGVNWLKENVGVDYHKTIYQSDGKWYSYHLEPRKWAKMMLGR